MKPGITRRRLLQAMGMTSAGILLTGCKTMPTLGGLGSMVNQAVGNGGIKKVNAQTSGLKPWSQDDQQKAERAKWVLDHLKQTGKLPWVPTENAYPDQVTAFSQVWQRLIAQGKAEGQVGFEDYMTLALGSSPLLVQASLQEAGSMPAAERPFTTQSGHLKLPPGASASFRVDGCCMDDELVAPARGEQLTIRPIDGYIHPDLVTLYQGVNREYTAGNVRFNDYQQLIWAIRNVETKDTPYIANLQPAQIDTLNSATPGGANLLRRTHLMAANNPLNDLAKGLTTALSDTLNMVQINVNGQTLSPMSLLQQGNTDQAIEGILNNLTAQEPTERLPQGDLSDFTVLDNGLVVQSQADDRLSPGFTIVNPTNSVLEFDPGNYVAESRRDTQRLTIPYLPDDVSVTAGTPGVDENDYVADFIERAGSDFYLFTVDTILRNAYELRDGVNKIMTPVAAKWSPFMVRPEFDVVKRHLGQFKTIGRVGVDYMPVVGNMLSLYEAVAGHHLLEPDNPSSLPERGLAVIGIIPGGRMAVSGVSAAVGALRASEDLSRKAMIMANAFSNHSAIKGLRATEIYRDIAWWSLSDAHEELTVAVDERWENQFTESWRNTIEYVKSL